MSHETTATDRIAGGEGEAIKLPVRYDPSSHHVFEADGHSLAWIPRNTHNPRYGTRHEAGETIARYLNEFGNVIADRDAYGDAADTAPSDSGGTDFNADGLAHFCSDSSWPPRKGEGGE